MNYPQTNGFAYTLASAHCDIAGSRVMGIQKIAFAHSMEGSEMVPGASLLPIAETPGMYKATVEFDILWSEFVTLIMKLGDGYMLKRFNIGAQLQDAGLGLCSVFAPNCRIIDDGGGLENKAAVKTVKCSVLGQISMNGITAVGGQLGGGNVLGAAASVTAQVGASVGFTI